jgi:hypothetical protein
VCKVAQPLFFVGKTVKNAGFFAFPGVSKLASLYFRGKTIKPPVFPLFQGCAFAHPFSFA